MLQWVDALLFLAFVASLVLSASLFMGASIEPVVLAVGGAVNSAVAVVTGQAPEDRSGDRNGRQDDKDLDTTGLQASDGGPARPADSARGTAGGRDDEMAPAAEQEEKPLGNGTGQKHPHSSSPKDTQPPKRHKTADGQPQVQGAASKQARTETAAPTGTESPAKPDASSGDASAQLRPQQGRTGKGKNQTTGGEAPAEPAAQAKPANANVASGDGPGAVRSEPQQQGPSVQRQHFGPSKLGSDQVHTSMAPMAPMSKPAGRQPGTSFSVQTSNKTHAETSSLTTTERGPGTSNLTKRDAAGTLLHQAGGRQAVSDAAGNTQVYEVAPTAEGDSFEEHVILPAE